MNDAAQMRFTPGTVISGRISGHDERLLGDQLLHRRDLGVEELDVAHDGVDRFALLGGNCSSASYGGP